METRLMRPEIFVVLPDVHSPFHNPKLVIKIGKMLRDIKPDCLIISGDFLDLFTLSKYNAGNLGLLGGLTLSREYEIGRKVLDVFDIKAKKHFLFGNHEDRWTRYMQTGDTAKLGHELIAPEEALNLEKRDWSIYRDWQNDSVRIGPHLEVIHGTYLTDHCAKKHMDAFNGSVIFGHSHRFGSYINGQRGGYNIGYLGDSASPGFAYAPRCTRGRWTNGFAIVFLFDDGTFLVNAIQCWKDRFVMNGRVY